ncbi:MAG: SH3 domain-containing protein, partial [Planctomycetaceae bacterium]
MRRACAQALIAAMIGLLLIAPVFVLDSALADSGVLPGNDAVSAQTGPYATSSGAVNVRGGPGTGFWIRATLALGEVVPILGISPDGAWWYVNTHFGEGWVAQISVTATNATGVAVVDPGPIGTVTSGVLNVRFGAGDQAASLGQISQGQQV